MIPGIWGTGYKCSNYGENNSHIAQRYRSAEFQEYFDAGVLMRWPFELGYINCGRIEIIPKRDQYIMTRMLA